MPPEIEYPHFQPHKLHGEVWHGEDPANARKSQAASPDSGAL